jgi:hypothetical protein
MKASEMWEHMPIETHRITMQLAAKADPVAWSGASLRYRSLAHWPQLTEAQRISLIAVFKWAAENHPQPSLFPH